VVDDLRVLLLLFRVRASLESSEIYTGGISESPRSQSQPTYFLAHYLRETVVVYGYY